jgi:hypothetical protein
MVECTARWRGLQAGVEYAEGFAPAVPEAAWFSPAVRALDAGAIDAGAGREAGQPV